MKRFTGTEKWTKHWFRKLPPKLKLFWDFVCDNCDCAGVWSVDLEAAHFYTGEHYTEAEILTAFENRIHPFDGGRKWWITGFIEFQYGELSEKCKPHKAVIITIRRHGLTEKLKEYANPSHTLQEQEKEKDKEQEKEKDSGGAGGESPQPDPNFYPPRQPGTPTESEQVKSNCLARQVIAHLNHLTGSKFTESAENMDPIAQRLRQTGMDTTGCKLMVERQAKLWGHDSRLAQGLTPKKLFGENFESYYGQREKPLTNNGESNGNSNIGKQRTKPDHAKGF